MRHVLYAVLCIVLFARPALAQTVAELRPGQKLRVVATGMYANARTVVLVEAQRDSLIVMDSTLRRPIPLSAVTRLEVADGRRSQWKKGAKIGATGLGVVGLASFLFYEEEECTDPPDEFGYRRCDFGSETVPPAIGTTIIGSALWGGLLGAAIGALVRTDRWKPVALSASIEPRGAAALRVSFPVGRPR